MTTIEDVKAHKATGSWRAMEKLALEIVSDASKTAQSELNPVLGGGTRLMLALEHRISDDIDLFIRDPQWIGYLSPRLNDKFEGVISDYDEGATSLKLKLANGEIDFIVSMSLLGLPNEVSSECAFELEPVAEVLAKKLFFDEIRAALTAMDKSVKAQFAWSQIRAPFLPNLRESIHWAQGRLRDFRSMNQAHEINRQIAQSPPVSGSRAKYDGPTR